MDTKRHLRPTLIILLIITTFFGMVLLGAGSHGNISLKNKQTATIICGGTIFILCAIANLISMRKKYSAFIGLVSFILNLICSLILVYYLLFLIKFNIDGGHFPIIYLVVIGIEIIMGIKIIMTDLRELKIHRNQ